MIQYQYFHTSKGYVSRLSLDKEDNKFYSIEELFETVRKNTEGNTFTYAPTGSTSLLMQSTKNNNEIYVKGLLCDDIPDTPAKFIDKFETGVSNDIINAERLPEGSLPVIGRRVDDFSLAQNLHHIFAKLIDALLYDDYKKKIIIIADNHESAVNYIKVLSLILPVQFMRKIGFCIGANSIPDGDMTSINERGESQSISVRIWVPEIVDFDFDTYASFYYVFDTKNGRDNYSKSLSSTAKVIEEINLCDQARAKDFTNRIATAFTNDGNVNLELLEQISALYLFELKKDIGSAKTILNMGAGDNSLQERAVINAIQFLLEPNNSKQITAVERSSIIHEYKTNEHIAQAVEEPLFNHLAVSYASLGETEKYELIKMIANDDQGERLEEVLSGAMRGDFKALVDAFELGLKVLNARCETNGAQIVSNKDIVQKLIEFFDFSRIRRRIPTNQHTSGEDFFSVAWSTNNSELQHLSTAILMASVYSTDTVAECCTVRIRGFKRMLIASGVSPLEQLDFIIMVRDKVLEIADEIPELKIPDSQFDFLFNNEFGKLWCNELMDSLSVDSAIKAEEQVRSLTSGTRFYEGLSNAIRSKLLDLHFVKSNVKSGYPVFAKYVEFFNTLPLDIRNGCSDIQKYLNDLDFESKVSDDFAKYRSDFAFECFETLSPANKQKVMKAGISATPFSEMQKQEKIKAVENTIKVFGTVTKVKAHNQAQMKPFAIWAFCLSILSSVLLILPAIIQVIAFGTFDFTLVIERIVSYVAPGFVFIPLYVFALNVASYLLLKEGNRAKRANIITLLCGVLPVLMFALGYLIFYFWGIHINIPFLQNLFN